MEDKEYYFDSDLPKEIYDKKLPMFSKEDFVPETDELKMTNPFLYNFKDNKNIIYSIEEFGLLYKKRKIYVGSVVRNEELSKFRKRKILKKYFNDCKKEFILKYRQTKKQVLKSNSKEVKNEISLINRILLYILLIINCTIIGLMSGKVNDALGIEYSNEFLTNLKVIISNDVLVTIINISLYLLVFTILYIKLYFKIINNYNFDYKVYLTYSIKTLDDILELFKKEYEKAKKHYVRKINSSIIYCPTISLDGLWNLEISFNDIISSKLNIETKNINTMKLSKVNKIILKCMNILIILSNAFTVGLFIFVLLKSIVNKI